MVNLEKVGGDYLEDGLPVDGSVVNNHGDRKSPRPHLLAGMILQVLLSVRLGS